MYVGLPEEHDRREVLRVLTRRMRLAGDVSLDTLAQRTERCTCADLEALCRFVPVFLLGRNLVWLTVLKPGTYVWVWCWGREAALIAYRRTLATHPHPREDHDSHVATATATAAATATVVQMSDFVQGMRLPHTRRGMGGSRALMFETFRNRPTS